VTVGDLIVYLIVAFAAGYAAWRFLPRSLKRKASPLLARLFGQRISQKLESAGACGSCDSCKACATPAENGKRPLRLHKQQ
jgi:hypothetical protein